MCKTRIVIYFMFFFYEIEKRLSCHFDKNGESTYRIITTIHQRDKRFEIYENKFDFRLHLLPTQSFGISVLFFVDTGIGYRPTDRKKKKNGYAYICQSRANIIRIIIYYIMRVYLLLRVISRQNFVNTILGTEVPRFFFTPLLHIICARRSLCAQ